MVMLGLNINFNKFIGNYICNLKMNNYYLYFIYFQQVNNLLLMVNLINFLV